MRRENNPILNSEQNGKGLRTVETLKYSVTQPTCNEVNGNAMGILVIRMDYTKYRLTTRLSSPLM
jgi:hypothetical protein